MVERPQKIARWWSWTWAHRLVAIGFLALLVLGGQTWFLWLKGSATSTRWFGILPVVDPLSGLEAALASRTLCNNLLIGTAIVVVVAVLLGRVFCGWLCPLGLVLDLSDGVQRVVRRRLLRWGLRLPRWQIGKNTKYWLLLACLVVSCTSQLPIFTTVSPINLGVLALLHTVRTGLVIVAAVVLIETLIPRGFCRSLCPLGALHASIGRRAKLAVQVRSDRNCLAGCRSCTLQCPMGIQVLQEHVEPGKPSVDDGECTRCGTCVDGCPANVIQLGWTGSKQRRPATAQQAD